MDDESAEMRNDAAEMREESPERQLPAMRVLPAANRLDDAGRRGQMAQVINSPTPTTLHHHKYYSYFRLILILTVFLPSKSAVRYH